MPRATPATPKKSPSSPGARDILVTGFPSFVAVKLVETLFAREPQSHVRLIVRPDYMDQASRRLSQMQAPMERVSLMSGDVVSLDLGLSGREYLELVAHVTDVYHLAGIWYLGVDHGEAREVNVTGARNVLDTAYEMRRLERLNHLSTAFVSGARTGVLLEEELDAGTGFRNAWEGTKFEAEQVMRQAMAHLPVSIYRPSLIVGDSRTGAIERMAGPYYLMNAIVNMPAALPMVMPGRGEKPLNLVPVDYVCEAMHAISLKPETAGKTFHLCDPNPLSARRVFELVAESAGKRAPVGALPYRLTRMVMKFPYLERLTRSPRQFMDDFNHLAIYNTMNTLEALRGTDVHCPAFPQYVERLVEYLKVSDMAL